MTATQAPKRLILLDIDGLRSDVWLDALQNGKIPNLSRLAGGPEGGGLHLNPVSPLPSITFCAQSSIFTGVTPAQHGIPGNQFFDRFGLRSGGAARFYAFDIGDSLAVDDAVLVFTGPRGLLDRTLEPTVPTLYERAAAHGWHSSVVYHMLSRGADTWIRPNLLNIARFTKGGGLIGLSDAQYDREMLRLAREHLETGARPEILTLYFMGLDHRSHQHGPETQSAYLTEILDPLAGELIETLQRLNLFEDTLFVIVSDHGQIRVIPDDRHSLQISFPFDREMGELFDALGLDIHDYPGEDPNCDAVVASNGGVAHVYLQNRQLKRWADAPRLEDDVLPVARAFWVAHQSGLYSEDLRGALSMVLVRDVQHQGWNATFQALTPAGELVPVEEYLNCHPEIIHTEAASRLKALAGPLSGDLLLVSNYAHGFYFGGPTTGVHGGLHPEDSLAVLSFGWPGSSAQQWTRFEKSVQQTLKKQQQAGQRQSASLCDLIPILTHFLGW